MEGSATVHIEATPEKVWAVVSDVTRVGEWSPECVRCEWVDGATGPAEGAKFKGHNKRGWARWSTTSEVTTVDPGREFAFQVQGGTPTVWRYSLQPSGDGTDVVESFSLARPEKLVERMMTRLMGVKDREADLTDGVRQSLERLKGVVEGTG